MSGLIAGGAILGASALGKGIYGAVQDHKASEIEKANQRPVEGVDPIYQENVNTAQQIAEQGLPQQVINNQLNGINQNQAGAISSLSDSANPGAGLASIVRQGDAARGNLNAEDAAARNKATLMLIQQRGILAGAKQNAWNYNYADKYSENLAKSQALRAAGTQNIAGGLNTLAGAGMSILGNPSFKTSDGPDGSSIDPNSVNGTGVENAGYMNNYIAPYKIAG